MPTAVASPRDRMISPMIVAWFRSPPGEDSRTMSPAARLAWSSLSRNQFAAAGPIVPLTKSARRPCAAPSRSSLVDHRESQARRDVLVLPVVPGLGLRQVAVGANADAGDQQDEDGDRPEMPLAAGRLRPAVAAVGLVGGMRGAATAGPVGDLRKRSSALAVLGLTIESSSRRRAVWDRAGPISYTQFMAEDMAAMPAGMAAALRNLNARRRCAWPRPAWRRAWPGWPVRGLNPSRRRARPR